MPTAEQTLTATFAELAQAIGLSRPAGLCFSVIWRAAAPPCADDLSAALGLSRSNISTALKELRSWGLINVARAPGDRKEYFTAPTDPAELLTIVTRARQRLIYAPLLDRLLQAEADTADIRIATLHEALGRAGQALESLVASVAPDTTPRDKPKKKKKKG